MSSPADRDLSDIIGYTIRQWGRVQARRYVVQIRATIARIAEAPNLVPDEAFAGMEFKKRRSGHHMIYTQVIGSDLLVARILHEQMDAAAHLN